MNQTDQAKVLKSGFTFLRRQDEPKPLIKIKTADRPWVWLKHMEFESKAARDREMTRLLESSTYLED